VATADGTAEEGRETVEKRLPSKLTTPPVVRSRSAPSSDAARLVMRLVNKPSAIEKRRNVPSEYWSRPSDAAIQSGPVRLWVKQQMSSLVTSGVVPGLKTLKSMPLKRAMP